MPLADTLIRLAVSSILGELLLFLLVWSIKLVTEIESQIPWRSEKYSIMCSFYTKYQRFCHSLYFDVAVIYRFLEMDNPRELMFQVNLIDLK